MVEPESGHRVAVVILNWNNTPDTLACLRSVIALDYPVTHIIVVDNGSTDDSVSQIREAFPGIEILETGENLGYTGGNNVGIRYALSQEADYIWLLNDDSLVAKDALSSLIWAANVHPDAGFLGPMVRIKEKPDHILFAGGFLDPDMHLQHRGLGEIDQGQYRDVIEVDYLSGCALLVRRSAVEKVGLLDERFFTYGEDVEWCYRGKQAGIKVLFVPQAVVWHPDTQQRDISSPRVMYYSTRNHLLFLRKHRAGIRSMSRTWLRNSAWLLNWSLNPRQHHSRAKRDALWSAMRDFVFGRFGRNSKF